MAVQKAIAACILTQTAAPVIFLSPLEEIYLAKSQEHYSFEGKAISSSQFPARLQTFIEARRNIRPCHFVYTGAAPYRAAQGKIQKKPRGGSRGVMTRSFSGR